MKNFSSLNISDLSFLNYLTKKAWKMGEKKFTEKVWACGSGRFISNGPILLVWETHGKFELEGFIQKLFTVKPRATGESHVGAALH